jgi:hypothetical protein
VSASDLPQNLGLNKYYVPQVLGTRATRRFHVMAKPMAVRLQASRPVAGRGHEGHDSSTGIVLTMFPK